LKRMKRRYLALQLECEILPCEREFMDAVWAAVTKLYGEVGERKIFVVRTSLASLPIVKASLATVTGVAGRCASVHVLSVSGTLKALSSNIC
jgi:RNase P/RNase MRP subunit POP5